MRTYLVPYVWQRSDIKLQCSFCSNAIEIEKGKQIPENLKSFKLKGRHYLSCPKCQNGFLKIFVKTKRGNWRFKSRTLFTKAIKWRTRSEQNSAEQAPKSNLVKKLGTFLSGTR